MEIGRADASERKPYYGEGRQPWDVMLQDTPWAPYFAAGCILRYLRRPDKCPVSDQLLDKYVGHFDVLDQGRMADAKLASIAEQQKHSLDSARWYYKRLREMSSSHGKHPMSNLAAAALMLLEDNVLTPDERKLLEGP